MKKYYILMVLVFIIYCIIAFRVKDDRKLLLATNIIFAVSEAILTTRNYLKNNKKSKNIDRLTASLLRRG